MNTYSFAVGEFDHDRPLIIDPLLQGTYFGGDADDRAYAMKIHPTTGDVYIAGITTSASLPGAENGAQQAHASGGGHDAFVSRLNANLTGLLQTTFFGGNGDDQALALAIHPTTGEVYVTGITTSTDLPGTTGAAQPGY